MYEIPYARRYPMIPEVFWKANIHMMGFPISSLRYHPHN
jgi:hypothetical protein